MAEGKEVHNNWHSFNQVSGGNQSKTGGNTSETRNSGRYGLWRNFTPIRRVPPNTDSSGNLPGRQFLSARAKLTPSTSCSEGNGRWGVGNQPALNETGRLTKLEKWRSAIRSLAKLCGSNPHGNPATRNSRIAPRTEIILEGIQSALSFALCRRIKLRVLDSEILQTLTNGASEFDSVTSTTGFFTKANSSQLETFALIQTESGRVYARVVSYANVGNHELSVDLNSGIELASANENRRWLHVACAQAASAIEAVLFRWKCHQVIAEQDLERERLLRSIPASNGKISQNGIPSLPTQRAHVNGSKTDIPKQNECDLRSNVFGEALLRTMEREAKGGADAEARLLVPGEVCFQILGRIQRALHIRTLNRCVACARSLLCVLILVFVLGGARL